MQKTPKGLGGGGGAHLGNEGAQHVLQPVLLGGDASANALGHGFAVPHIQLVAPWNDKGVNDLQRLHHHAPATMRFQSTRTSRRQSSRRQHTAAWLACRQAGQLPE